MSVRCLSLNQSHHSLTPISNVSQRHSHVSHMSLTCLSHVSQRDSHATHMSLTCLSHVSHMSLNVTHMSLTCLSHVTHMSLTCLSHVSHMSLTCLSHVSHMSLNESLTRAFTICGSPGSKTMQLLEAVAAGSTSNGLVCACVAVCGCWLHFQWLSVCV